MKRLSDGIFITFSLVATFICVAGVLLNSLAVAVLARKHYRRKPSNFIVLNICFTDLFLSVSATPLLIAANATQKWPFGDSACKAYAFIATLSGVTSMNLLAGAAFERYNSIKHATTRNGLFGTAKRTIVLVILIHLYSLTFSVIGLVDSSLYSTEGIGTSCSVNWSSSSQAVRYYIFSLYLGCFVLPLSVIAFSYLKFFRIIRGISETAKRNWGRKSVSTIASQKQEKRLTMQLLCMIVAFLISWTPYATVGLISSTGHAHLVSKLASSVPSYLAKLSCTYNPILYFLIFKHFRQDLRKLFQKCYKKRVYPEAADVEKRRINRFKTPNSTRVSIIYNKHKPR